MPIPAANTMKVRIIANKKGSGRYLFITLTHPLVNFLNMAILLLSKTEILKKNVTISNKIKLG